jgi:hypothetical protein
MSCGERGNMALGITVKDGVTQSISVPLKCKDKEWTADHLRYLAAEIDKLEGHIYAINVGVNIGYESLNLEIVVV